MSELGDDARAFLAQARGAHRAPAGAKERVRGGLAAALGASSSAGDGQSPRVRARSGAQGWVAAAKVAVAVALVGGGAALLLGRSRTAHEAANVPAPTAPGQAVAPLAPTAPEPAVAPQAPAPSASSIAISVPASTPRATAPAPVRASSDQSVAAEVALLRRVSASLRAGDAKGALAGVDEHARRFPNGALAEERDMERIVALCALGRREEGARATEQFLTAYPTSSHEARIRAACAAPATPGVAQ